MTKSRNVANFVVTGGNAACRYDNLLSPLVMTRLESWQLSIFTQGQINISDEIWERLSDKVGKIYIGKINWYQTTAQHNKCEPCRPTHFLRHTVYWSDKIDFSWHNVTMALFD